MPRATRTPEEIELFRAVCAWGRTGAARVVRESAKLSRQDVALALSVGQSQIRRWETGEVTPTFDHAIAYGRFLQRLMRPPSALPWSPPND